MVGLIDFSTDAASNDMAAPPILWVEGQPAKTVNDSMRATMAALANWRDDNVGSLGASRGAGDVYNVSTAQGFLAASVARPHTLRFRVASANQTPASLSLDGLPAKPLLRARGRPVGPGDIAPDTVYAVSYIPSEGAYFVTSPAIERPGRIVAQADAGVEPGWLPCDGRAVSRADYSALFAVIGTTWGNGNGSTTFNIPDLRGRAMFGADNLGGTAANVLTGVGGAAGIDGSLGSSGGVQAVTLTTAQMPKHSHTGTAAEAGGHSHGGSTGSGGSHDHGGSTGSVGNHTHSGTTVAGGSHSHTGSAAEAGSHSHNVKFSTAVLAGGNDVFATIAVGSPGANGNTDAGGSHTHSVTINAGGDHQHGFTTDSAGGHTHTIPDAPNHAHTITAAADHTHALSLNDTGSGAAHANMPPGAVVAFAIKT
ncbi:tail fiber protein [Methylobacterium sp. WCS2018Hpa-22]|uniref:tail fiber protein n=1 Tax=Methylobacterium sp. WCS2018Hpa-22 TaxID=3073633 RepID=UPI00288C1D6C|nr:tail fiber protein [Methylobacterium sp. WCS2018Hpa-22]